MADNVVPRSLSRAASAWTSSSLRVARSASVGTLQAALMHCKIKEAKDLVRLHKNEDEFWTPELCL